MSEVTGDPAIIHIRDDAGKGSSAIPIGISDLKTPVPSLFAFEKEIFPLGKYYIDVEYSGIKVTAEFELIDSGKVCIPELFKPIFTNWLTGIISDGFLMDAFQKYIDKEIIDVPFEINEDNVYEIDIPDWLKNVGFWWAEGKVTDEDFINVVNYLIDREIISAPNQSDNEI